MEFLSEAQVWWGDNSAIILAILASVGATVGVIIAVWSKIQTLIDKVKDLKDKVVEGAPDAIANTLKASDLEVRIQDLKEKINNPTTSEDGRKIYTAQLEILIKTKLMIDATDTKIEEETSRY
jgi:hypothetical protein